VLTEKEFMAGMGVLMRAYPDYECTAGTVDVYRDRLCSRLTPKEWEAAVNRHLDTCKWFPKISEIFKAVQDLGPSAQEVWSRLIAAAEDGEEPEMDAATAQALAVIGGWEEFSRTSYDALPFRFKEFKAAYLEAREAQITADSALQIEQPDKELRQITR
jgi:hypothetical protein